MDLRLKPCPAIALFPADTASTLEIPFFREGISAGFPSPAMDFEDLKIDLNKHLVRNPSATFFGKVKGQSLKNAGIDDGDLMVIDRSAVPRNNKIAVVFLDGEFTAKRIQKKGTEVWLMPENEAYPPIKVHPDNQFLVWGIVTFVIKAF
ncbi:translesion error-prone DNA polymerase V autoproteolytic subunit [Algoriphagus aestuariicola]|uniref:Translesion error-prone DNA polymerase V autoproteolytic subunit n=1 Tax=Algoriphagus aestuariicola TaxID=1852016 RepID=A0ABS3BLM5_9BACT|nr:translesion error-prone DNA polymerase V autoproteolytic subunit [Algoriphagus aestuariicola]MBN7800063.1 translesion error-prone DNA polymerase V autoproteolytic subunit [Algoriphagus aestuariicola]